MKYCPKCREQYPDRAEFCGNDGSQLAGTESSSTESSGIRCKACGKEVDADTLFCPGCGAKVYTQKSLDSFHKGEPEEERRFTMGTVESVTRTSEIERPQQAEARGSRDLRLGKKKRKGLYLAAGGAIVVAALIALFAVPRILEYWHPGGPSGAPNSSPSPTVEPLPPPAPTESSPIPGPQESTATAPDSAGQGGQTAAIPPAESSSPEVSREPQAPSKSIRRPSSRPGSELAAKKKTQAPLSAEAAKNTEPKQLQSSRKEEIQTPTQGGGPEGSALVKERPVPRRPAEPGTYETIRTAMARRDPSDSAEIIDQIKPRTRLTVVGSEGDWLVVHSITRNRTVYVNRDDAMFVSEKVSTAPSGKELEARWRELERQIQQQLSNQGITGVSVSFIRDTAYLKGTVQTEQQRFSAEQAAWSFPEVRYIYNGIWVKP